MIVYVGIEKRLQFGLLCIIVLCYFFYTECFVSVIMGKLSEFVLHFFVL